MSLKDLLLLLCYCHTEYDGGTEDAAEGATTSYGRTIAISQSPEGKDCRVQSHDRYV